MWLISGYTPTALQWHLKRGGRLIDTTSGLQQVDVNTSLKLELGGPVDFLMMELPYHKVSQSKSRSFSSLHILPICLLLTFPLKKQKFYLEVKKKQQKQKIYMKIDDTLIFSPIIKCEILQLFLFFVAGRKGGVGVIYNYHCPFSHYNKRFSNNTILINKLTHINTFTHNFTHQHTHNNKIPTGESLCKVKKLNNQYQTNHKCEQSNEQVYVGII